MPNSKQQARDYHQRPSRSLAKSGVFCVGVTRREDDQDDQDDQELVDISDVEEDDFDDFDGEDFEAEGPLVFGDGGAEPGSLAGSNGSQPVS